MQLKCEYCGAEVDTKKDKVCPFCGGSYDGNKEYEEKRAREEESKRIIMERRKLELEQRKREALEGTDIGKRSQASPHYSVPKQEPQHNILGGVVKRMIIMFVMVFILMIVSSAYVSIRSLDFLKDDYSSPNVWNSPEDEEVTEGPVEVEYVEKEDIPVTVDFNEVAETSKYTIKCDNFEVIDRYPFEPAKDYQYVTFHFVVENISDDRLDTDETIDCLVDGIMCQYQFDTERNEIPRYINKGIAGAGNICFEVPIAAESFDIKYGEYVTIHIENTLNQ